MNKNFSFLPRKRAIEPQQYRGMEITKYLFSLVLYQDTHIKHSQSSKKNLDIKQKSKGQTSLANSIIAVMQRVQERKYLFAPRWSWV